MAPEQQAGWVVAVVAGVLSFVAPCVLPLIPGYLSMISGLSMEQLEERKGAHLLRVFISCALFAFGFAVAFMLLGATKGVVGPWLRLHATALNIVFGIIVILFGLFVLNLLRLPFLYQDHRLRFPRAAGMWAAPLLGFAFGFGWTPCIGPWLAVLYSIAPPSAPGAIALFGIYSLTLGLCFIAAGMLFALALRSFAFLQRHYRVVEIISGGLLVLIGLLLVTQQWNRASAWLMGLIG